MNNFSFRLGVAAAQQRDGNWANRFRRREREQRIHVCVCLGTGKKLWFLAWPGLVGGLPSLSLFLRCCLGYYFNQFHAGARGREQLRACRRGIERESLGREGALRNLRAARNSSRLSLRREREKEGGGRNLQLVILLANLHSPYTNKQEQMELMTPSKFRSILTLGELNLQVSFYDERYKNVVVLSLQIGAHSNKGTCIGVVHLAKCLHYHYLASLTKRSLACYASLSSSEGQADVVDTPAASCQKTPNKLITVSGKTPQTRGVVVASIRESEVTSSRDEKGTQGNMCARDLPFPRTSSQCAIAQIFTMIGVVCSSLFASSFLCVAAIPSPFIAFMANVRPNGL